MKHKKLPHKSNDDARKVKRTIAIIGGGLAGVTAALMLQDQAHIVLFEKSRGLGGRIATRRMYEDEARSVQRHFFDHGAQYFTARSNAFQQALKPALAQGIIQDWKARVKTFSPNEKPYKRDWYEPHYIAADGMNALVKLQAKSFNDNVSVMLQTRIAHIEQNEDSTWQCVPETTEGQNEEEQSHINFMRFDHVILAVPQPQALDLLKPKAHVPHLTSHVENAEMLPCYTLMLGFDPSADVLKHLTWDAAMVKDSPISWMANQQGKNGDNHAITIHATHDWATRNLDRPKDELTEELLDAISDLKDAKIPLDAITHQTLHLWRYSAVKTPVISLEEGQKPQDHPAPYLHDQDAKLSIIGDWCIDGRVEGAFLSAHRLSTKLTEFI